MKKQRISLGSRGIAHLLALVSILVVAAIGGVGYYVYHQQHKPPHKSAYELGNGPKSEAADITIGSDSLVAKKYRPLLKTIDAATSVEAVDAALKPFADDYGITANRDDSDASSYIKGIGDFREIAAADLTDYKSTAHWYIDEWSKYPTAWMQVTGIKGVVFVTDMKIAGSTLNNGGAPDYYTSKLYLNATNTRFGYDYTALTLHHEFGHLVDYDLWGTNALSQRSTWDSFNPAGFVYTNEGGAPPQNYDPTALHPQPGFVSAYSATNYLEDRAETYSALFTRDRYLTMQDWLPGDPYLTKKIDYYKSALKQRVPSMDDAYFKRINK